MTWSAARGMVPLIGAPSSDAMPVAVVKRAMRSAIAAGWCGAAAACSSSGPTAATYTVSYHLTASSQVTFDSVMYANSEGSLVKVIAPSSAWVVVQSDSSGSYIQAAAWGSSVSGGQSAKLTMTWTQSGVSTAADSSIAVISAPGSFALTIPRRRI